MQGGLSAYLVLLKPDIWEAFKQLVTCHRYAENESEESSSNRFSRIFSSAVWGRRTTFVSMGLESSGPMDSKASMGLESMSGPMDSKARVGLESMSGPLDSKVDLEDNVYFDGSGDNNASEEIIVFSEQARPGKNPRPELFFVMSGIDLDADMDGDDLSDKSCPEEIIVFSQEARAGKNPSPNSTLELYDNEDHDDAIDSSTDLDETDVILELKG